MNSNLRSQLDDLIELEESKKKEHTLYKGQLQESWDKLVNLRTHINLFKADIEEALIEEPRKSPLQVSTDVKKSRNALIPFETLSTKRLTDVNNLKEKMRLKEELRRKVAVAEQFLLDLRKRMAHRSDALAKLSRRNLHGSGVGKNTLNLTSISETCSDVQELVLMSDSLSVYMETRKEILNMSNDLEKAEEGFLKANNELKSLEKELSMALQQNVESKSSADAPPLIQEMLSGATEERQLEALALAHGDFGGGQGGVNFNDVISGASRVKRHANETVEKYRCRLETRLLALTSLDSHLQQDLEHKTNLVRRARDEVRYDISIFFSH